MWAHYLGFDTLLNAGRSRGSGSGPTIGQMISGANTTVGGQAGWGGGMACVGNLGNWANWTGHLFAASNVYGCGQLGWDTTRTSAAINREWAQMTFPEAGPAVAATAADLLERSWAAYEGYTSPLGIGWQIAGNPNPFGCAPATAPAGGAVQPYAPGWQYGPGRGPDGRSCPISVAACHNNTCIERVGANTDHYWVDPCANFDFQNSSTVGLGCDRTSRGPGSRLTETYAPALTAKLDDPATCPRELLLFFHNRRWDELLPGGSNVTLMQHIAAGHGQALTEVAAMATAWSGLRGAMAASGDPGDLARWAGVRDRLAQQVNDANVLSGVITKFYHGLSGLAAQ